MDIIRRLTSDVIQGNINVYNESGNVTNGTATLLLAYKENGVYIGKEEGSLRIAYVGEGPVITTSSFWIKQVTTIEILSVN